MAIRACTPQELADLYRHLSPESRAATLSLLPLTAADVWRVVSYLPPLERLKYVQLWLRGFQEMVLPALLQQAVGIVREHPNAGDAELRNLVADAFTGVTDEMIRRAHELKAAQLKQARDRKDNPQSEPIRREARRLREQGRTWRYIGETLWQRHPEWFPDEMPPEDFQGKPAQRKELLTRLAERVRGLCKNKTRRN